MMRAATSWGCWRVGEVDTEQRSDWSLSREETASQRAQALWTEVTQLLGGGGMRARHMGLWPRLSSCKASSPVSLVGGLSSGRPSRGGLRPQVEARSAYLGLIQAILPGRVSSVPKPFSFGPPHHSGRTPKTVLTPELLLFVLSRSLL